MVLTGNGVSIMRASPVVKKVRIGLGFLATGEAWSHLPISCS